MPATAASTALLGREKTMTEKVRGPWLKFVDEFAAEGADKSWLSDCAAVLARAVRSDPAEMRAVVRGSRARLLWSHMQHHVLRKPTQTRLS